MADYVPSSGAWQTDPELRQLMAAAKAEDERLGAQHYRSVGTGPARIAYRRYIDANRARLGIPDNYVPDPRTNGQTLYDPNQNQLRDAAITGASMAAGGYGLGQVLGGTAATQTPTAASGLLPNTSRVPLSSVALNPPGMDAVGGVTAGGITGATGAATTAIQKLRQSLTSPEGIAGLAALIPSLIAARNGGGDDGQGSAELNRIRGITEARMRRADPLHEVATQLAFSRAPVASRAGITLPRVPLP